MEAGKEQQAQARRSTQEAHWCSSGQRTAREELFGSVVIHKGRHDHVWWGETFKESLTDEISAIHSCDYL